MDIRWKNTLLYTLETDVMRKLRNVSNKAADWLTVVEHGWSLLALFTFPTVFLQWFLFTCILRTRRHYYKHYLCIILYLWSFLPSFIHRKMLDEFWCLLAVALLRLWMTEVSSFPLLSTEDWFSKQISTSALSRPWHVNSPCNVG